jgi:hypothetical protein
LKHVTTTLLASAFGTSVADSAATSPTISLGYADCASCHLSPQGAGLLTAHGAAVEEARSLRVRENSAERHPARRPMLTPTVTNGGAARIAVSIDRSR